MKQSKLFTRVERSYPKDETAVNAKFLTRAGFIYKNSAGVYSFLPLGLRVIRKISDIVREEMNAIGGQEILMSTLHDKKYLTATGRWNVDVVYKVIVGEDTEPNFNISWTHEEIMAEIAAGYISSYKDLPFAAYQIQTKFRHEPRAKSGLLRGREFLMKDLYSFHHDEKDLYRYYDMVRNAYFKVFKRCNLKAIYTVAAGGNFTINNTHEFQIISDAGEDTIYVCSICKYAINDEVALTQSGKIAEGDNCPKKCRGKFKKEKAIEIGNIFPLGTKYSESFNVQFTDKDSSKKFVVMGSYGIGISRLMGVIVEKFHDEHGIIWPESVAPFTVHLLELPGVDASPVYEELTKAGVDVLYDDRDMSAGEKFADADLIGIPYRAVLGTKYRGKVELKKRNGTDAELIETGELIKRFSP